MCNIYIHNLFAIMHVSSYKLAHLVVSHFQKATQMPRTAQLAVQVQEYLVWLMVSTSHLSCTVKSETPELALSSPVAGCVLLAMNWDGVSESTTCCTSSGISSLVSGVANSAVWFPSVVVVVSRVRRPHEAAYLMAVHRFWVCNAALCSCLPRWSIVWARPDVVFFFIFGIVCRTKLTKTFLIMDTSLVKLHCATAANVALRMHQFYISPAIQSFPPLHC